MEPTRRDGQLAPHEDLYRRAIVQSGAVPYVLDYEPYGYSFIGEGVEELTGFTVEEFNPEMWGAIIIESVMQGDQTGLDVGQAAALTRAGEFPRWRCDLRIRTKTGEERWLSDASVEIRDETGAPLGSIGMLQDITERKRVEQTLAQRELELATRLERLETLAGGLAHDFNNLLIAILGHASLARSSASDPDLRTHLEQIELAGQRAADLTQQMLAYAGAGTAFVTEIQLGEAVETLVERLRRRYPLLDLKVAVGANVPPVTGDADQLERLILNLVDNAVEAVAEGGSIAVRLSSADMSREALDRFELGATRPAGAYVLLEVRDSGHGMDAATRARVFDPFFSTKFTGRGLGLAAVIGIVRSHRGAVQLESEPGRGTAVRVLLPAQRL
jgi:two-component system cell cycle sensor histidine kinase/response regulator CckA